MKIVPTAALLFLHCVACASSPSSRPAQGPEGAPARAVEVRLQMVEAPAGVLAKWLDTDPSAVKIVTPAVADEMLAALRKEGHVASRPSIFVQPGATASFATTNRVDHPGARTSDGKPLEEGCWIQVAPTIVDDGWVDVAFSIQSAALAGWVQDAQGTVPVPVMHEEHCSSRVTVAPDGVALLRIDRLPAVGANVRCAVLRVRPAEPDRIPRL